MRTDLNTATQQHEEEITRMWFLTDLSAFYNIPLDEHDHHRQLEAWRVS
ncbi:hypothetical protein [Serratia sp. UGAL515B_01]|nr:hypothetical protein [Serratia sp. UGAL515B_01]WON76798.1 hypothetical protein OK023_16660 [Serratia sp. UGAL515B_01]